MSINSARPVCTFRVSNVLDVQTLQTRVRRPARFDLMRYWTESIERFERELFAAKATALATARGLQRLRQQSAAVARAVGLAPASQRADGRVRLKIPIEAVEQSAGALLRLAPDVEVLHPPALRQAVVQRLREAWALYAGKPEAPG
jgi:predicted DNA-binding transcriptional regulator YafY